ncbi:VanZ family protein [Paenibacillus sp. GSMTC-2017]|uniref:VanZ family protein n=1 Tax=Paenibacillus sp. GSMTC-2017 TaxID=2794350 RepID=UPI0018DA355A|nr:VanZ family protein [Paenibacillus sp. GSMTC-2017]MBH5320528.1 VanZ family protein [Paenibacillus sp. GSMTC-2017]
MFKKAYSNNLGFNIIVSILAILYAMIMLNLLFLRDRYYLDSYAYNFVPFDTIWRYIEHRDHFNFDIWFKNLFGNLILFIPIGMFLPLLNRKYKRTFSLIAACIVLIGLVEVAQMLLRVGSFDIDDIILNTAGAWLGLLLTKRFMKRRRLSNE